VKGENVCVCVCVCNAKHKAAVVFAHSFCVCGRSTQRVYQHRCAWEKNGGKRSEKKKRKIKTPGSKTVVTTRVVRCGTFADDWFFCARYLYLTRARTVLRVQRGIDRTQRVHNLGQGLLPYPLVRVCVYAALLRSMTRGPDRCSRARAVDPTTVGFFLATLLLLHG